MSEPSHSRAALVIAALLGVVGAIGAVGSWGAYLLDSGIEARGVRAQAHVTGKRVLAADDGDSDFIVEYWFALPSGQRLQNSIGVSKKLWSTFEKGAQIEVFYSAENPKRNVPVGAGVTSLGLTIFISLLSAVVGLFGFAILRARFKR